MGMIVRADVTRRLIILEQSRGKVKDTRSIYLVILTWLTGMRRRSKRQPENFQVFQDKLLIIINAKFTICMGRSGKWEVKENNFSGSSNELLFQGIFIDRASFQSFYNFKLTTVNAELYGN